MVIHVVAPVSICAGSGLRDTGIARFDECRFIPCLVDRLSLDHPASPSEPQLATTRFFYRLNFLNFIKSTIRGALNPYSNLTEAPSTSGDA